MPKILLVEDEKDLALSVRQYLESENISVEVANDGVEGYEFLRQGLYDVAVLDWDLPGLTGIEILQRHRAAQGTTPILMLTGKHLIDQKEAGFEAGADDYLTKPFNMRELLSRIKALSRRSSTSLNMTLKVGNIEMDSAAHQVYKAGKPVHLLPKDFALLELLMRHPGEVFSSEAIVQRVWSFDADVTDSAVRTSVLRLRKKLDDSDDENLSIIENVRRVGYRLRPQ
ncbi:MAG TPA: response regulator transcription factor [Planktothrix sp.]